MIKNEVEKLSILDDAARILHEEIRQIQCQKLPEQIKTKNLIDGECRVKETLINFYTKLISGENYRRRQNKKTTRLAKSFSEDLIFAIFNGKIKLSKHICFGLTLKSLTNSQKIVNIVNRYGHCCSYSTLEGLETEATFTSCELSEICPEGIIRTPDLYTGVAFDNYDRFVETTTGKDTLHDTVGIIYQIENNIVAEEAAENENALPNFEIDNTIVGEEATENENGQTYINVSASQSRKHRRSFDIVTHEQT